MPTRGLFPDIAVRPGEILIHPWSYQSLGSALFGMNIANPVSTNWIGVGTVIFVPFWVPEQSRITKLWWGNAAAVAGNFDVGIYDEAGTLLVSTGTTTAVGAQVTDLQTVDVTDTTIQRGRYYMAMVSDTSGATQKVYARVPAAGILQSLGLLQQLSVTLPLASNASPATFAAFTQAFIPLFGLQVARVFSQ